MKAMLEKLTKHSKEKEARVKLQEENSSKLTRKLELPVGSFVKSSKLRRKKMCPSKANLLIWSCT